MTAENFKRLIPPNLEYNYFQKAENFPFNANAAGFDLNNAAWLIDLSFLAYVQDTVSLTEKLQKVNLHNEPKFFGYDNSANSTQCFVAHNDEIIIVAFRGTEISGLDRIPSIVEDIITDLDASPMETGDKGLVHTGFNRAANEVWNDLEKYLKDIRRGQQIWFTGHSLGAAVATIVADRYLKTAGDVGGLYTFGSPRVGDQDFEEGYKLPVFRFIHSRDIVTTVPSFAFLKKFPPSLVIYKHIGQLKYIDDAGSIGDNDPRTGTEIQTALRQIASDGIALSITRPFIDHAPILYSEKLWGNLAD